MTWLTADLAGSGGILRSDPEDFVVEEILAYEASGSGEHAFAQIEKTALTTPHAAERLAEAIGLRPREVGYAGLKDKHARTRQWMSFPVPVKAPLPELGDLGDDLRVLSVERHGNKLKRSHARGNRFAITIRDTVPDGADRAAAILDRMRATGVPNAFGPQRFGRDGDNAQRALRILRGDERRPKNRRVAQLLFNALQSEVFNRVLALRIEGGLLSTALVGDVMKKHDSGGLFDVADPAAEQPRVDRVEISPTAALPGKKTRRADGQPQAMEDEALRSVGLGEEETRRLDVGTRRALRFPLDPEARIEPVDGGYRLHVALPAGAYATVLLAELIKPAEGVVERTEG